MTGFDGYNLPPPSDWQKFERLARDLWAEIWSNPQTLCHGRSGQPQHGVDVYGVPKGQTGYSGVQCKRHGSSVDPGEITEKELRDEVTKALGFVPRLEGEFILATTGARDGKIQKTARQITVEHEAKGLFSVHVFAWEDIQAEVGKYPEIFTKHFGDVVATVRAFDRDRPREIATDGHAVTAYASGSGAVAIAISVGDAGAALDSEHHAQIDAIRALLKKGQAKLALEQGEALRARVWASASAPAKAHLLALLGHATLELGDDRAAAKLLVETVTHAPTDAPSQANAAFGHFLQGSEKAARTWADRALSQAPLNSIAVQVAVILDGRSDEEVLGVYEVTFGARSELFSALGERARRREDWTAAEAWFAKAAALEPAAANTLALAGQATIDCISRRVSVSGIVTSIERGELRRSVALLERAWSHIKDEDALRARVGWIASRTVAKQLLGDPDAAASAEEVLRLGGDREDLVMLCVSIASSAGDHQKVIELVDKLACPGPDARGARAAARANLGDLSGSLSEWEALFRLDLSPDLREQIERNYVHLLVQLGRSGDARATLEGWLAERPDDLARVLIAIETGARLGDRALRDAHLDRALTLARADAAPRLLLRLGDALMRAERASDAADVYALVTEIEGDSTYGRRQAQALYLAGRFESALESCRRLTAHAVDARFCAEVESLIHEQLGDLSRARAVCESYLDGHPGDAGVLLRLGTILFRAGDEEDLARVLSQIDRVAVHDHVQNAAALAQLLSAMGRLGEALEVLFETRRRNMGDPAAHLQYIARHTFLSRGATEPTVAGPDVAVELSGQGAPGWVLLSTASDARISDDEYPEDHPIARAVVGKRVGDPVTFPDNPRTSWTVTALGSKFGFAFRQSLSYFPKRFPAERAIEQHETPQGEDGRFVEQLRDRLAEGEPHRVAILAAYAAGEITVGSVAHALGRSNVEGLGIVATSPTGLRGSTGSQQEKEAVISILRDPGLVLVADLTSCILLDSLGVLRDGALGARRLAIAQSTLDELRGELLRWRTHPPEGFLSVALHEGHLVRIEITAADLKAIRERYESLAAWLKTHCAILAVVPAMAEKHAAEAKIASLVGESFWDSMLIASEPGRTLLSDDLALRRLYSGIAARASVCSPLLLLTEADAGRLSADRYGDCIAGLITSGYRHISTDARVLHAAAKAEQWRPQGRLLRVLDTLKGPETEPRSAALVAAQFFRLVWFDVVIPQQRETLWMAVLDALCTGRPAASVLPPFKALLPGLFALLPFAGGAAARTVAAWERLRIR